MALLVRYKNEGLGYITKYELNDLISNGEIEAFMRPNGQWVNPVEDPIRMGGAATAYFGPERRSRF
jgi:hypothetical protein